MTKQQKQYDKQFKIDAVEHYLNSGKAARVIAEHFGIMRKLFMHGSKITKKMDLIALMEKE